MSYPNKVPVVTGFPKRLPEGCPKREPDAGGGMPKVNVGGPNSGAGGMAEEGPGKGVAPAGLTVSVFASSSLFLSL